MKRKYTEVVTGKIYKYSNMHTYLNPEIKKKKKGPEELRTRTVTKPMSILSLSTEAFEFQITLNLVICFP